jgi:iron complex transport system permease protein
LIFPLLALLLLASLVVGAVIGPIPIPLGETVQIIWARIGFSGSGAINAAHRLIIGEVRLPRALTGALVGLVLGISGAVMQGIFRNPLADPYLLGIASGASAGAALVIALHLESAPFILPLGSFIGGAIAVIAVYRLGLRAGRASLYSLILAGIALGTLFSAVTSFLITISGEELREIVFWIMGGLGRANWTYLPLLAASGLLGSALVVVFARDLNAMALGEAGARHLGIDPERLRQILLAVVTLMTGAAVAVSGTIGFVGLITPHALRLIVGPDHRLLLPASALAGASFLVFSDTLARTVLQPVELPVGIITAFVGVPFFLYLLMRARPEGAK